MSKGRPIRCFDYVNHPYERVRDALRENAPVVFRNATKLAASRASSVASELRVQLGGLEVGTDIAVSVQDVEEHPAERMSAPITRLRLEWEASRAPRLFPMMRAELTVYPLTGKETQLDFYGHYEPPLGVLGSALDAIVGHRIAEASVHRFVSDVADYLRRTLAHPPA
jgi:hypothetical protein